MQRINIAVDIENNQMLTEEIEKAIDGAVKARVRESFQKTVSEEINRVVKKNLEGWTYTKWGESKSRIQKEVESQIDDMIRECIGSINVTGSDIQNRIDEQLDLIGQKIDYAVSKKLEKISLEEYIANIVADEVRKSYPEKVLQLIVKSLSE